MKKRRIIVNNDYFNIFQVKPPVTDADIHAAVDGMLAPRVPGSQVDALFLMADHGFEGSLPDELVKLYDHPDVDPCVNSLRELHRRGVDPWAMVLARARKRKIDLFASFRMNDTHYKDGIYHPWVDSFYYDNLHNRLTTSGAMDLSRNNTEFDYRKSVVREYFLKLIRANLDKYDVDGVELDLTRNCKYFPDPNREECAPVMTDFVRQVRGLLDAAGKKRKRKLELAVTVPYSLYRCRLEGLDIPAWARLGYIDMLCMSSPFMVDTQRDIADTVRKAPGVPVYAGCDRNFQWPGRPFPREAYRAMAMSNLRQGAAGTYLYNVMHWTMRLSDMPDMLKNFGGGSLEVHDLELAAQVGQTDTLERLDKLYLVSAGGPAPDHPNATLPVTVPALGETTVRLFVGDDIAAAARDNAIERITLQSISPDCDNYNNYTLKLNGIDLARQYAYTPYANKPDNRFLFPEPENKMPTVALERVRRHPVRPIDLHQGVNYITIKSWKDAMTISDIELAIIYKK